MSTRLVALLTVSLAMAYAGRKLNVKPTRTTRGIFSEHSSGDSSRLHVADDDDDDSDDDDDGIDNAC